MGETALDLRYNISALVLAICSDRYMLPETAFSIISSNRKYITTDEDKDDMLKLIDGGLSYREVGETYGLSPSNVHKTLVRYKARKEVKK